MGGFDLTGLIAPTDVSVFFQEHWEKKPLTIHRSAPGFFDSLFSLDNVDQLVTGGQLRRPEFRLVKDGTELPDGEYTKDLYLGGGPLEGVADPEKILRLYAEGSTLVLEALHRTWKPVRTLCRKLEKFFTHSVQANAYLTPRGSQGFKPHYDTHDVFILQVSGVKRWRLYASPVKLPHDSQKFDSKKVPIGQPESEFDLEPGDVIYIPRGFIHEGLTTDSHSLHLTIGIPVLTWADVFIESARCSLTNETFLKSLPVGFAELSEFSPDLLDEFRGHMQRFIGSLDLNELLSKSAEKYLASKEPNHPNPISAFERGDTVEADSVLKLSEDVVRRIVVSDDKVKLVFEGKKIEFPLFCHQSLVEIESLGVFSATQMSNNIDLDGRIVLLQRLVDEGYLTQAK
jgi:ribosomal protein L16 Arg81 hydroxylase